MNTKASSSDQESDSNIAPRREYAGPKSPTRVMQVVEMLAEAPQGTTLAQLAHRLRIPKTSILNHLRVLIDSGHIALQESRYVLGPASLRLGTVISANSTPLAVLRPIVKQLSEDSGETCLCGSLDEKAREVVYIAVQEGREIIRYAPPVGTRRQLYCAGMGRALLAFQPEEYIDDYFAKTKLESYNANTVTSPLELKKIFARIRSDRVSITVGEVMEDLGAIASPIIDARGQVQYSIGVAVPVVKFERERNRLTQLVLAAGERASWGLGA
jgi:DNA-binding IclR family transcriptional regulator